MKGQVADLKTAALSEKSDQVCLTTVVSLSQQNFLKLRKSLKRGSSLSLSFSNPWTPLHLYSMWPSSRAGLCVFYKVSLHPVHTSVYLSFLIMWPCPPYIQVCWTAWRLCLCLWRLSYGGGRSSNAHCWLMLCVRVCVYVYSKCASVSFIFPAVRSARLPHRVVHPAQHDHAWKAAHPKQRVWGSHTVCIISLLLPRSLNIQSTPSLLWPHSLLFFCSKLKKMYRTIQEEKVKKRAAENNEENEEEKRPKQQFDKDFTLEPFEGVSPEYMEMSESLFNSPSHSFLQSHNIYAFFII